MLYSILIYGSEDHVAAWTPEEYSAVMDRHAALRTDLTARAQLGPVVRLAPRAARTLRNSGDITDGPYAETKEQLMGIYIVDCASFEEALAAAKRLDFATGVFEITPIRYLDPGQLPPFIPST